MIRKFYVWGTDLELIRNFYTDDGIHDDGSMYYSMGLFLKFVFDKFGYDTLTYKDIVGLMDSFICLAE